MDKNIRLLKKLMSVPSPASDLLAAHRLLDIVLGEFAATDLTVERFSRNGVSSALIYNRKKRPKNFRVLLTSHLDVIPETDPEQYKMRTVGDKIYGGGVLDMKAGAAVAINLFKELAPKLSAPVALQLVIDEEIGGFDGAKYQVEQGVRADFVIATEPTNFAIVHEAKGILQGEIIVRGFSAHGAYPWRGDNALRRLNRILTDLHDEFPDPTEDDNWHTTLNLAKISTNNEAFNAIPDQASALIDVRFVPDDSANVESRIRSHLDEKSELNVRWFEPAIHSPSSGRDICLLSTLVEKNLGVKATLRGANGSSDARHFAAVDASVVEFGPSGGEIHSGEGEWVSAKSLPVYESILRDFLGNV